jgi:hypothetical protein
MIRAYPLRPVHHPAPRPEGLRSIIRRLEAEIERQPRVTRVSPAGRSGQSAHS